MNGTDLAELRHLVDLYADAVDRRDGAAIGALFEPGATLTVQADGGTVESELAGGAIAGGLLESVARYDRTFHHVGGAVFEADGDDRARGRVHCLAHHYERTANGPVDLAMALRYHDRYRRRPAGWTIETRRVAIDWTELRPAHPRRR